MCKCNTANGYMMRGAGTKATAKDQAPKKSSPGFLAFSLALTAMSTMSFLLGGTLLQTGNLAYKLPVKIAKHKKGILI
jgi:hypothetical protein